MTVADLVEANHVNPIPASQRHGAPWQQFALWAGFNGNAFNVVLGAVLVPLGLTFWWAVIAVVSGTAAGVLLIALHATQGPRLGVPQMIQSRAQLGFDGVSFLLVAVLVLNLGLVAAQLVIAGQAMNVFVPAIPIPAWILILTPPALVIGVYGYRWVHRAAQVTAVVVGVTLAVMLAQGLAYQQLPAAETSLAAPRWGLFLAAVALLVIDMPSFGPFVSDYSRYLPASVRPVRLAGGIWTGNLIATVASCVAGAYIAALLPKLATVAAIGQISGRTVLVIMAASLVNGCTVNAYTGSMQVISLGHLLPHWRHTQPSARLRIATMTALMTAAMVIVLAGHQSFVANLSSFLDLLLVVFVPWSAVNVTDYFLVRRARYDVASFFTTDGSYGRFAWRGLAAYATGLVLEVPFVSQVYYTGPIVRHLDSADISWIIGFLAAGLAYLALTSRARRVPPPQSATAPERS